MNLSLWAACGQLAGRPPRLLVSNALDGQFLSPEIARAVGRRIAAETEPFKGIYLYGMIVSKSTGMGVFQIRERANSQPSASCWDFALAMIKLHWCHRPDDKITLHILRSDWDHIQATTNPPQTWGPVQREDTVKVPLTFKFY